MRMFALFAGLLLLSSCMQEKEVSQHPQTIDYKDVTISGELKDRADANFLRLHKGRYLPDSIYLVPNPEYHQTRWPGDVPGRLVLAITLMEQATHQHSKNLQKILDDFPLQMNGKGYFGKDYGDMINEQQLSSHGWVLRGLAEHYEHTEDTFTLRLLKTVVDSLVLPTKGHHATYPIDPAEREDAGEYMGSHSKAIGKWITSTDVGCDFIFMDGVVHAYEILRTKELEEISREMIMRFLEADLKTIKAQTHATLTGLRAILRFYDITGEENLLTEVEKRFELYKEEGMTENWENYNWFGRPRWTEPCAVIDSYIAAYELWRFTKKPEYLKDAQLIYYNGIGAGQRWNGGFGCNSCLGNHDPYKESGSEMFIQIATDESHWCCTMRGGEGFAKAVSYSAFIQGDTIFIPDLRSAELNLMFRSGKAKIEAETDYPFDNSYALKVNSIEGEAPVIKIYAPEWMKNIELTKNNSQIKPELINGFIILPESLAKEDVIKLTFDQQVMVKKPQNIHTINGYHSYCYGPLMLGTQTTDEVFIPEQVKIEKTGQRSFRVDGQNIELTTVNHLMSPMVKKEHQYNFQALFRPANN